MHLIELVCRATQSKSVSLGKEIQSLWSGYGVIQHATLGDRQPKNVVVKHIDLSNVRTNRRGWGGDTSHQRKVHSYLVEKTFYESYSANCDATCYVPEFVGACEQDKQGGWVIVLEDLNVAGFDLRKNQVTPKGMEACLDWLANFHATFMASEAVGLWSVGTYWHLETRKEEWAAMPAGELKHAASAIDERLNRATYQTLVHGDAKLANFCFSSRSDHRVAGVDFQYVGRGCGMKDVAYLISSCLHEEEAAEQQDALLDHYFHRLQRALVSRKRNVDFGHLEAEWRSLYPFAWADFCRFLAGWSPGHWKLNAYTDEITKFVLRQLSLQ